MLNKYKTKRGTAKAAKIMREKKIEKKPIVKAEDPIEDSSSDSDSSDSEYEEVLLSNLTNPPPKPAVEEVKKSEPIPIPLPEKVKKTKRPRRKVIKKYYMQAAQPKPIVEAVKKEEPTVEPRVSYIGLSNTTYKASDDLRNKILYF